MFVILVKIILVIFFVLIPIWKIFWWFYKFFIYKSKTIKKFICKRKWVIVTGCTSGIGRGFSLEISKRGCNVILISRNIQKLNELAKIIEKSYGVMTKVVVIDFTKNELKKEYEILKELIEKLDVTCLINNVGIANTVIKNGKKYYGFMAKEFVDHDEQEINDYLNVNIKSALLMTKYVLPKFTKNRKGLIINISSTAAILPWTKSIRDEYYEKGIEILALLPTLVQSKMVKEPAGLKVITPEFFAKKAFDLFGFQDYYYTSYWFHDLIFKLNSFLYQNFRKYLMRKTCRDMIQMKRQFETKKKK